jgi:hypothetical protein
VPDPARHCGGLDANPSPKPWRRLGDLSIVLPICVLLLALAGSLTLGCSGPVANIVMTAPATAVAGSPFTVTVSAMVNGAPDTIFASVIIFSSSDKAAILPGDYLYTSSDAGSHTYTNGVTLNTPGNQTITVVTNMTTFLTATATIAVSSAQSSQ